jgi:large subunit ribosomal protein L10
MPAEWKIKEVEDLAKKLSESPVIAVAGIKGLPSKQFQQIRKKLHDDMNIWVTKLRLARMAIGKAKGKRKDLEKLEESLEGPTAFIFSKDNPFKLNKLLDENRSKAPAKPGDAAPHDIVVPAGDTPFKPGPIIGELQGVGIKAKIRGGIIVVTEDSPVIKKGERFSRDLASVLTRMEIEPMEIGMDVRVAYEDGIIYSGEVLRINTEKTLSDLVTAHRAALNLAIEAGIYNKETIKFLMSKAAQEAKKLAMEAEIYTRDTVDYFLAKAGSQAKALSAKVPEVHAEEKREEKAEPEAKAEGPKADKKEEAKAEKPEEEKSAGGKKEEPKAKKKEEPPAEEKEKVREGKPKGKKTEGKKAGEGDKTASG